MQQAPPKKLHALTSLRFFAAAMIVFHHSNDLFGFPHEVGGRFKLDLAVAFFFALSGFILTYVYPSLDSLEQRARFLLARIARVWPAHLAAFGLLFLLLQNTDNFPTHIANLRLAALNLALLHAWIPLRNIFFSFNPVSWTISTEFFFYLAFPLLILNFQRNWWIKLTATLLLALAAVLLCQRLHLPLEPENPWGVSCIGILYINPISRLFEFTLGMCACLLFRKTHLTLKLSKLTGTLLEAAAVALVVLNMYYASDVVAFLRIAFPASPLFLWIAHGPVCALSFTLLIYIMALHRGYISTLLSTPLGTLLGEISYSVYLLHYLLITWYQLHQNDFIFWPNWLAYATLWAVILLLSYLVWVLIERPFRTFIVTRWPKPNATSPVPPTPAASGGAGLPSPMPAFADAPARPTFSLLDPSPLLILIVLALAALLLYPIYRTTAHSVGSQIKFIRATGIPDPQEVRFDKKLLLLAAKISSRPDGLDLALAWQTIGVIPPGTLVGIHLVDDAGKILAQDDYTLHPTLSSLPTDGSPPAADPFWIDHIIIPTAHLNGATHIAISLYHTNGNSDEINKGPRDWKNHRLLLPLPTH